jgi:hypothetical protein
VAAVHSAVQATLRELATQPGQHAPTPPSVAVANEPSAAPPGTGGVGDAVRRAVTAAVRRASAAAVAASAATAGGLRHALMLWALRRQVVFALACGSSVALAGYLAAPWLSAALGGFGGTCAALLAQAKRPLRQWQRLVSAD